MIRWQYLFHIEGSFGTGFDEHQAMLLGELVALVVADLPIVGQVTLVSNHDEGHCWVAILFGFI
jgi:hypothetical protein